MIKTYSFDDGKYEFDRDQEGGCLTAVRRNDEHWPAGWEDFQFSKVIHAMLNRIDELEDRFFFVKDAPARTGYSQKAVRKKIETGVWLEGHEYRRAPDNRIVIDMEGFEPSP